MKHNKQWFLDRIGKYVYRQNQRKYNPLDFHIVAVKIDNDEQAHSMFFMQENYLIEYYKSCDLED